MTRLIKIICFFEVKLTLSSQKTVKDLTLFQVQWFFRLGSFTKKQSSLSCLWLRYFDMKINTLQKNSIYFVRPLYIVHIVHQGSISTMGCIFLDCSELEGIKYTDIILPKTRVSATLEFTLTSIHSLPSSCHPPSHNSASVRYN